MPNSPQNSDEALVELLGYLQRAGYDFVATTPATHARVIARGKSAQTLRDVLGWSLPFKPEILPPEVRVLLERAGELERDGDQVRSSVRVSACGGRLFVHSRYPTAQDDAVFFGPDSYRFVRFVKGELGVGQQIRCLVDLGCGTGVGAIMAGERLPDTRLVLLDSNSKALRFAAINAAHAGVDVAVCQGALETLDEAPDLIIANPPYILDPGGPTYRHGGSMHGAEISLSWARSAIDVLAPGGRLLLYTGSAIVGGKDRLKKAMIQLAQQLDCALSYEEIDPDVFGEELDRRAYEEVERIAVIGAVLVRSC